MPKEMLTVVDKPLIHYAVEEAQAAGIEEFIFVTGRAKTAIEDHFESLRARSDAQGARQPGAARELQSWLPAAGQIAFTRQQRPLGLGHAVWCARNLVGDEPFAVLLVDDLMVGEPPCLKQMVDAYEETGGNLVAVVEVPRDQTGDTACSMSISDEGAGARSAASSKSPSRTRRHRIDHHRALILQPEIFRHLAEPKPGSGNEIQLTDGLDRAD